MVTLQDLPVHLTAWGDTIKAEVKSWLQELRAEFTTASEANKKETEDRLEYYKTEIRRELDLLRQETQGMRADREKKRGRMLTEKRSMMNIGTFDGKQENYDDWKFKSSNFFGEEGKVWREVLHEIERRIDEPDDKFFETIGDMCRAAEVDPIYMNTQIYSVLTQKVSGKALTAI